MLQFTNGKWHMIYTFSAIWYYLLTPAMIFVSNNKQKFKKLTDFVFYSSHSPSKVYGRDELRQSTMWWKRAAKTWDGWLFASQQCELKLYDWTCGLKNDQFLSPIQFHFCSIRSLLADFGAQQLRAALLRAVA